MGNVMCVCVCACACVRACMHACISHIKFQQQKLYSEFEQSSISQNLTLIFDKMLLTVYVRCGKRLN